MSGDPRDELRALGEELSPTAEQVASLVDGSLEAEHEAAPTFALLSELPSPQPEEIRALKARVVEALEAPARPPWPWIAGIGLLIAGGLALAWLL